MYVQQKKINIITFLYLILLSLSLLYIFASQLGNYKKARL